MTQLTQLWMAIAALFGGLAVAAGAFGSHALKGQLSDRALAIFETGNRYQMYHALALLLVTGFIARSTAPQPWLTASAAAFVAGTILFSGSLYALSLTGVNWWGAVAPVGGTALMVGWGCLAIAALTSRG